MVQLLTCNGVVDYLLKKWLSREFRDWTFTEADSIGVTIDHVSGCSSSSSPPSCSPNWSPPERTVPSTRFRFATLLTAATTTGAAVV
ncbi:unnamed protein product [Macrosiphum euphorbiae]|uniref:Uncharacterized protein n=1 Tax=Macrosiphum euphorbiae TaxID=13131 RepID=A0AAV0XHJ5_9HEMI|nr:unnamed protein product [Macrosiphum euphorbiae]